MLPRQLQVVVDLVGDHIDPVLLADLQQPGDLLLLPYPAHGVVGGTEDKGFDLLPDDDRLEVLEVRGVDTALILQHGADQTPPRILHGAHEGIVAGAEDDAGVPRLRQRPQEAVDAADHAGGVADPGLLHLIAVALLFPVHEGLVVGKGGKGIAVGVHLRQGAHGFPHAVGAAEIHVRHPHGDEVVGAEAHLHAVPLGAAGAPPVPIILLLKICHDILPQRMKLVNANRASGGGKEIPACFPASMHLQSQAMFRPRARITCIPSSSFFTSSGLLPWTTFQ